MYVNGFISAIVGRVKVVFHSVNECNCIVGFVKAPNSLSRVIFQNSLMFCAMRGTSVHRTKGVRGSSGRERSAEHVTPGSEANPSHTKRKSQPSPLPPHWLHSLISAFLHSYAAWPEANAGTGGGHRSSGKCSFIPVCFTFGPVQPCKWHQPEGLTVVVQ